MTILQASTIGSVIYGASNRGSSMGVFKPWPFSTHLTSPELVVASKQEIRNPKPKT